MRAESEKQLQARMTRFEKHRLQYEQSEKAANAERAAHEKAEANEIKTWVNTKSTFHANRAALAAKVAEAEKKREALAAKIAAVRTLQLQDACRTAGWHTLSARCVSVLAVCRCLLVWRLASLLCLLAVSRLLLSAGLCLAVCSSVSASFLLAFSRLFRTHTPSTAVTGITTRPLYSARVPVLTAATRPADGPVPCQDRCPQAAEQH
jgi:hypothetical protein